MPSVASVVDEQGEFPQKPENTERRGGEAATAESGKELRHGR